MSASPALSQRHATDKTSRSSSTRRSLASPLPFLAQLTTLLLLLTAVRPAEPRFSPTVHAPSHRLHTRDTASLPVAVTFFWFNNKEVGICYDLTSRVRSSKRKIACNAQDDYDSVNNTFQLPQTCVSLMPQEEPLLSEMTKICEEADGKFEIMRAPQAPTPGAGAGAGVAGATPGVVSMNAA